MKDAHFVTTIEVNQFSENMNKLLVNPDEVAIQSLCNTWEKNTHKTAESRLQIFYNIGTGYAAITRPKEAAFDDDFTGLSTLNYRKALAEVYYIEKKQRCNSQEIRADYTDQKARLETNLANELLKQGRVLEAITFFDSAVLANNVHAVLGKARCLYKIGQDTVDWDKAFYLYRESANNFNHALSRIDEFYIEQQNSISKDPFFISFSQWFNIQEEKEGSNFPPIEETPHIRKFQSKVEKNYFYWCSSNTLFINELNSISDSPLVYNDNTHLPSFSGTLNSLLESPEELSFHGHYDEMKTDYCYARYIAYLGCSEEDYSSHFFNSTFDHVDTLDYQINDLKTNHLKSSFKISYSIFDKIAFFLHRFFNIQETSKDHRIDFKSLWFKDKDGTKLREKFKNSSNPYFRALFFLSKDIRQGKSKSDKDEHSLWFDPDTNRLFDIRNAIEHRSFKLVDGDSYKISKKHSFAAIEIKKNREECDQITKQLEELYNLKKPLSLRQKNSIRLLKEKLSRLNKDFKEQQDLSSYSVIIGIEEFERLTLKLLRLAKDALIYLSLSVQFEEQNKEPFDGVIFEREVPMQ